MKKIVVSSLISLFFLSCSVTVPNNTSKINGDFSDLEKEYRSFNTKALSDGYVSRMFNKFLVTTPNPTQVIRQLEFARYLKDVKTDSTYFNSLKTIISNDSSIYTKITTTSGVPEKKSAEPASFGVFVDSLSPLPGVPVATSATGITANSFTANWNAVSGATSYIIVINGVETTLEDVTTYTKSGLTGGTAYSYSVKAINSGGTSSNSNTVNVLTIPETPTANNASDITTSSFTANWSSVNGATGYKLTVDGTETDVGLVTSKNVTGLTSGITHTYSVKAYNASGTGTPSSTVNVLTIPDAPIANTTSGITSDSFTANWSSVTGATSYKLFVDSAEVYSGALTSFNVTAVNGNINHSYYVIAINNSGNSNPSNTINISSLAFGLSAYYPFNGNTSDQSGNNNNGTNSGAVLTTDRLGNSNKAYSFNGTSSFIDSPFNFNGALSDFSFSYWIKFTTLSGVQKMLHLQEGQPQGCLILQ